MIGRLAADTTLKFHVGGIMMRRLLTNMLLFLGVLAGPLGSGTLAIAATESAPPPVTAKAVELVDGL